MRFIRFALAAALSVAAAATASAQEIKIRFAHSLSPTEPAHLAAEYFAKNVAARTAILRRVIRDGLTVRQTEELARNSDKTVSVPAGKSSQSTDERHVEEQLQRVLGTRVQLRTGRKGGKVIITYFSADELEGLLERLGAQ